MKRQTREVYGFGPKLPTRRDSAVVTARAVLLLAVIGTLAGLLWH